ncbi:MAG: glycosyltransferase family 4 protein [Spirochaetia bacterium]|nr:glycosyltransferase family 4 protein [Spirochaetia bacterium]
MKRLLIVTDFFRPEPGGLEGLFTSLARFWSPDQLQVLVTNDPEIGVTTAEERRAFDEKEPYAIFRACGEPSFFGTSYKAVETLFLERLSAHSPDHVLFTSFSAAACAAFEKLPPAVPHSVFLIGPDIKNNLGLFRFSERRLLRTARNVFTVSRYLSRAVREFGVSDDKIALVPPGIEPVAVRRPVLPAEIAARLAGRTVLLAMGPLVARRGFDLLIETMSRNKAITDQVHLLIVGSGPEHGFLEELIRRRGLVSNVTMTGLLPAKTLAAVWDAADIVVQPGMEREDDARTLGTALMEAAYHGIPVVAGSMDGVEEIVRHGFSGILVTPGSAEALGTAIISLINSSDLREEMGRKARDMAKKEFDMARTCASLALRL